MEDIEYLEEYEDLVLPALNSAAAEAAASSVSSKTNKNIANQKPNEDGDDSSSSLDQDIFNCLFDDNSDDDEDVVNEFQRSDNISALRRNSVSNESYESLHEEVIGEKIIQKVEISRQEPTNQFNTIAKPANKITSSTPKPKTFMTKTSGTTIQTNTARPQTAFANKPKSIATVRPTVQNQQKLQNLQRKTNIIQRLSAGPSSSSSFSPHRQKASTSAAPTPSRTVQLPVSARKPLSSTTTDTSSTSALVGKQQKQATTSLQTHKTLTVLKKFTKRPATIVRPEKIVIKDPANDPLDLDDLSEAGSDNYSLSDISGETYNSISEFDDDDDSNDIYYSGDEDYYDEEDDEDVLSRNSQVIELSNDSSGATSNLEDYRASTPSPVISDDSSDTPTSSSGFKLTKTIKPFMHPEIIESVLRKGEKPKLLELLQTHNLLEDSVENDVCGNIVIDITASRENLAESFETLPVAASVNNTKPAISTAPSNSTVSVNTISVSKNPAINTNLTKHSNKTNKKKTKKNNMDNTIEYRNLKSPGGASTDSDLSAVEELLEESYAEAMKLKRNLSLTNEDVGAEMEVGEEEEVNAFVEIQDENKQKLPKSGVVIDYEDNVLEEPTKVKEIDENKPVEGKQSEEAEKEIANKEVEQINVEFKKTENVKDEDRKEKNVIKDKTELIKSSLQQKESAQENPAASSTEVITENVLQQDATKSLQNIKSDMIDSPNTRKKKRFRNLNTPEATEEHEGTKKSIDDVDDFKGFEEVVNTDTNVEKNAETKALEISQITLETHNISEKEAGTSSSFKSPTNSHKSLKEKSKESTHKSTRDNSKYSKDKSSKHSRSKSYRDNSKDKSSRESSKERSRERSKDRSRHSYDKDSKHHHKEHRKSRDSKESSRSRESSKSRDPKETKQDLKKDTKHSHKSPSGKTDHASSEKVKEKSTENKDIKTIKDSEINPKDKVKTSIETQNVKEPVNKKDSKYEKASLEKKDKKPAENVGKTKEKDNGKSHTTTAKDNKSSTSSSKTTASSSRDSSKERKSFSKPVNLNKSSNSSIKTEKSDFSKPKQATDLNKSLTSSKSETVKPALTSNKSETNKPNSTTVASCVKVSKSNEKSKEVSKSLPSNNFEDKLKELEKSIDSDKQQKSIKPSAKTANVSNASPVKQAVQNPVLSKILPKELNTSSPSSSKNTEGNKKLPPTNVKDTNSALKKTIKTADKNKEDANESNKPIKEKKESTNEPAKIVESKNTNKQNLVKSQAVTAKRPEVVTKKQESISTPDKIEGRDTSVTNTSKVNEQKIQTNMTKTQEIKIKENTIDIKKPAQIPKSCTESQQAKVAENKNKDSPKKISMPLKTAAKPKEENIKITKEESAKPKIMDKVVKPSDNVALQSDKTTETKIPDKTPNEGEKTKTKVNKTKDAKDLVSLKPDPLKTEKDKDKNVVVKTKISKETTKETLTSVSEVSSQDSPVISTYDKQTVVEPKLTKDKKNEEVKEKEALRVPSESTKTDNSKTLENSHNKLREKEQSKIVKEQGETKTTTNTNDSNTAETEPQISTNENKNAKQNTADSTTKTISSPKPTKKLEKLVTKTTQGKTDSAKLAETCREVQVCIKKEAIQENKKPVELKSKQNTADSTTKTISSPKPTKKTEKLVTKTTQDKTDRAKLVDTSTAVKLSKDSDVPENKIELDKTQSKELQDSPKDPKTKDDVNKKENNQDSPQISRKAANIPEFADASKEGEVKEAVTAKEEKIQTKRTRKSKVNLDASKAEELQLNEITVKQSNATTVQPTETSQSDNTNLINIGEPVAEDYVENKDEFVIEPRITRSRIENIKSNESITKGDIVQQTTAEKLAKPEADDKKLETIKQAKKNVLKEETENIFLGKDSNEKTQVNELMQQTQESKAATSEGARVNKLENKKGEEHFDTRKTRNHEDIKAETDKEKTDMTNVESSRENTLTHDELTSQMEQKHFEARKIRTRGVAKVDEQGKETHEITKIEAGEKSSAPEDLKNKAEKELAELKSQDTNEITQPETSKEKCSTLAESNIEVEKEHVETRRNRKRAALKVELEEETKELTKAEQNDETFSAKNQREEEHFEPRKKRKRVDLKTELGKETKELTITLTATQEQKAETLEPIKSRQQTVKVKEAIEMPLNETQEDDYKNETEEGRFELRKTRSHAEAKEKTQGESQEENLAQVGQLLKPIKTRKRGDLSAEIGKETIENTQTESLKEKSSAQDDSKQPTEKEHFEPRKTRRLADVKEKSGRETAELSPVESAAHDDSKNQTDEQPLESINTRKAADVKETNELKQTEPQEEKSLLQHDDKHLTEEHFEARKTRRHADVKEKTDKETTELTQVESSAHDNSQNQIEEQYSEPIKTRNREGEIGQETTKLKQTELSEDKHQTVETRITRKRVDIKADIGKETTTITQTELSAKMTPEQDLKDQTKHHFEPIKTRKRAVALGETAKETEISQAVTSSGKSPTQGDSKTETENVNTRKHTEIKTYNLEQQIAATTAVVVNQIEDINSTADEMQSKDNSDEVKQTENKEIFTEQLDSSTMPEIVARSLQDSLSLEADMSGSESSITSSNSDNTLRRTLRKRATETPLPENDNKKKLFKEPPLKATSLITTPKCGKSETATVIGSTTIKRISRSPALVAENPRSSKKSTLDTSRKSSRFRNLHDDCLLEEELPIVTADVSVLFNDLDNLHEEQTVQESSQNKNTEKIEKSLKNTDIAEKKSEEKAKVFKQTPAKVLHNVVLEAPKKPANKEILQVPNQPVKKEASQAPKQAASKEALQVPKQSVSEEVSQVPKQPAHKDTTQVPKQTDNKEASQVSKQLVNKDPLLAKSRVIVKKLPNKTEISSPQKQTRDLAKTNKAKVNISPNKSPGSNAVLSFSDWLKTKRQNAAAASATDVDEKITPAKVDQNPVKAKPAPKTLESKTTDGIDAESLSQENIMMCQNKVKDLDKTVESKQEHKVTVNTESMNITTQQLDNSLLQPSANQLQNALKQGKKKGRGKKANVKRLNKSGRTQDKPANKTNTTTIISPSKNKIKKTEIDVLMESMSKEMKEGGISDLLNTDTHVKRQRLAARKNLYDSTEQLNTSNSYVSSTRETANVSITIANTSASDVILNKVIPKVIDFSDNLEVLASTTFTPKPKEVAKSPTKRRPQQKGAAKSRKTNTLQRDMLNTLDIFSNAEQTPLPESSKMLATKYRKSLNIKELTGQQLKTTENIATTGAVKSRKSMPLTSKDTLAKVTNFVVASSRKSLVIPKQQQTATASDKPLTNVFKTPKLPAHSSILNEIPNANNIKKLYDGDSRGKRCDSRIRLHLTANHLKTFKCRKLSVRLNRSTVKKYFNTIKNRNLPTTQPNVEDTVSEVPASATEALPIIQNNFETNLRIQSVVEAENLLNATAITAAPIDTPVTAPAQPFIIPNTDTLLTYTSIPTPAITSTPQSYVLPTTSKPPVAPLPTTTLLNVGDTNETIELKNEFVDENPIGSINETILPDTPTLLARAQSITEAAQHALSSSITPTDIRLQSADSAANSFVASFGVTPTALDSRGTCMYTFLHPAKYNRNHSNVLLDYCCPNLDGPMPAIDPTRIHAQVQVPVIELPSSIVLTTKVVTRADLESGNASIPDIIRKKAEKIRKNLATHTKIAVATTAASAQPPGVVPVMAQPQLQPISRPTLPPTINALTKQLPATTTITPKMRPPLQSDTHGMASQPPPPAAAQTHTPTLSSTPPSVSTIPRNTTISVMSKGGHMLQLNNVEKSSLRSNLRRFDVLLKQLVQPFESLSFVDRHRIIEALIATGKFLPKDLDQTLVLMEEYIKQTLLLGNELLSQPTPTPTSAILSSNNYITTQTAITSSLPSVQMPQLQPSPSILASSAASSTASTYSRQLEQIHNKAVRKVQSRSRNTSLTSPASAAASGSVVVKQRQVPIYDTERNIIGYQMQMMTPLSTIPAYTKSTMSSHTGAIMSTSLDSSSNKITSYSVNKRPMKRPAQESPRVFYTTPPLKTSTPKAITNPHMYPTAQHSKNANKIAKKTQGSIITTVRSGGSSTSGSSETITTTTMATVKRVTRSTATGSKIIIVSKSNQSSEETILPDGNNQQQAEIKNEEDTEDFLG